LSPGDKLTLCAPSGLAILPRKHRGKRGEHVEDGPGDDQVVVEHHNGGDQDHAGTQSSEERAEPAIDGHGTQGGVLTEGEFHKHQRKSGNHQHYGEGNEEGSYKILCFNKIINLFGKNVK